MKKLLLVVAVLLLGTAGSITAKADPVTLKLTSAGTATQSGTSVGPVNATVNGTPIQMVCDDFSHNVSVGQSWTATVNLFSDLSGARFADQPGSLAKYQEAAWLVDQFALHPSSTGDIQFAIWSLFTPATPVSASISAWVNLAASQNLTNYDFSGFRVFTPTNSTCNSPQEFIARIPGAEVPEPTNLALLGSGLAGLATMLRRHRKPKA